jgi:hypothetical protein
MKQSPESKKPPFTGIEISFKSVVTIQIWREQNCANNVQQHRIQYDEKIEHNIPRLYFDEPIFEPPKPYQVNKR